MTLLFLACIPTEKHSDSSVAPTLDTALSQEEDDARVRALSDLPSGPNPCSEPILARVTDAVDGDTFWVAKDDGTGSLDIRVIGVDTPEISHNGDPAECWGNEAWAYTREALVGKLVWLTFDATCLDPYDRTLAYIFREASEAGFWNRNLARNGQARQLTIAPNDSFAHVVADDIRMAQQDNLGLWASCE